jgi:hypothetical protein
MVMLGCLAAACTSGSDSDDEGATPDGDAANARGSGVVDVDESALITGDEWDARTLEYLTFATDQGLSKGNVPSLVAHLERARRDPSFEFDATQVTPADYQEIWDKLDNFKDTGDFDINDFLYLWYPFRDELSPELRQAIEDHLLSFKYWWTEPTPDGIIDSQYYWTENHQIIYAANEYIAGQAFPDEVFTNSGMTGTEHMEHAEPIIRRWVELRSRFGFAEWLSNVYYMEDFIGLNLLAEFSDNEELATLASMGLDMLFVEIASHTQAGALGSTHGRSYMKDKLTALDEDNFDMSKLLFDDTEYSYQHVDTAVWMAMDQQYRVPEAVRSIALSDEVAVVKQRQSLPLDPLAPIDENDPEAPYGFDFRDPDDLMVWWGIGGQFPWQVVPLSVETMAQYDLWESDLFKRAGNLKPIVDSSTTEELQELGLTLARQLNSGLLSEASSYTWRAPEVMLSTAQCWRPGSRGEQNHSWQATLDAHAQVFTNHPRADVPLLDEPNANEGYWTGDGGMPCSVQVDNVGISIYAPQYQADTSLGDFDYLPYTHAFFPTERFDEVVEQDGWVFGRKGDGYVALWSYRPTAWREYDLATEHTRGLTEHFDLIADGGPDNVWITEVGRAADYESFDAFIDAITSVQVEVSPNSAPPCTPNPATCEPDPAAGYQVRYPSPSKGEITFSLEEDQPGPLEVDGEEVALLNEDRWDSPWATVPFDTQHYRVEVDGYVVDLDFETGSRTVTGG